MKKSELILKVQNEYRISKPKAKSIVDFVFDNVAQGIMEDGKAVIPGFGTFKTVQRAEKHFTNPKTGRKSILPETYYVVFKNSTVLKESL